jgi:hypothetical protein
MTLPAKTVAVIGASADRSKYGNKSVRAHVQQGWTVYPVHPTATEIEGLPAYPSLDALPTATVDRISLYVPPRIGLTLLEQIAAKRPVEVWLNPGTESDELVQKAEALGLPIIQACSIVDLGTTPEAFQ